MERFIKEREGGKKNEARRKEEEEQREARMMQHWNVCKLQRNVAKT